MRRRLYDLFGSSCWRSSALGFGRFGYGHFSELVLHIIYDTRGQGRRDGATEHVAQARYPFNALALRHSRQGRSY